MSNRCLSACSQRRASVRRLLDLERDSGSPAAPCGSPSARSTESSTISTRLGSRARMQASISRTASCGPIGLPSVPSTSSSSAATRASWIGGADRNDQRPAGPPRARHRSPSAGARAACGNRKARHRYCRRCDALQRRRGIVGRFDFDEHRSMHRRLRGGVLERLALRRRVGHNQHVERNEIVAHSHARVTQSCTQARPCLPLS